MKKNVAIKVENLSKKYQIGEKETYLTLRDQISSFHKRLFSRNKSEEFWALKNISFEVKKGEVIGIIGRNGAGKSTLLKILSRIIEPTHGKITMKGRVASLLEVGTGFNQELTGRENIFLNGAILGMGKKEIENKFSDIVECSGVEKCLDTSVKRYSSGMYVRLAFAVAAHLDADILLVDEVLAVGDMEFQKKCLGKMGDLAQSGKTVIFVSHDLKTIESISTTIIFLEKGKILNQGFPKTIIKNYFNRYFNNGIHDKWIIKNNESIDTNFIKPTSISINNNKNSSYLLKIKFDLIKNNKELTFGYAIYNKNNICIYWSYLTDKNHKILNNLSIGKYIATTTIPNIFNDGEYIIEFIGGLHNKKWLFEPGQINPKIKIKINKKIDDNPYLKNMRPTIISPIIAWTLNNE